MSLFLAISCLLLGLQPSMASEIEWNFETRYASLLSPERQPPRNWQKLSGAFGRNQQWEHDPSQIWHIELQREGAVQILNGLCYRSDDSISWGWKIFNWGQQQMQADGHFACDDSFHSTSLYIEALARSLILMKASQHPAFDNAMRDYGNRLLQSAHWLASSQQTENAYRQQRQYNHRRFLLAAALGQTGQLMSDPILLNMAETYLLDGISLQRFDGVYPEKGGFDTGYHAVSLIFAQRCLNTFAHGTIKYQLDDSVARGIQWLRQRVRDDGSIITTGNTRTGEQQERTRQGKFKIVEPKELARALLYRSFATQDSELEVIARKVITFANLQARQ